MKMEKMYILINKKKRRQRISHECDNESNFFFFQTNIPGDSRNIEKTIIDKTAEITSSAIHIPRQFRFSVDDIAIS